MSVSEEIRANLGQQNLAQSDRGPSNEGSYSRMRDPRISSSLGADEGSKPKKDMEQKFDYSLPSDVEKVHFLKNC
jgi:hypothetical protein